MIIQFIRLKSKLPEESLKAYRLSDLAASIPGAYEVVEAPEVESLEVLFQLRAS